MRALELGAVDFVAKPKLGLRDGLDEAALEIADKIRGAARARVGRKISTGVALASPMNHTGATLSSASRSVSVGSGLPAARNGTEKLIADRGIYWGD